MDLGFRFMPRAITGRHLLHLTLQAIKDQWFLHKGVVKFF
jgi:hypothetical protein